MINLSPSGSKNDPNTKLKIYDLENAAVKHAAVLRPNEFENKSRQIPKQKLAIRKVILLIFIGKVKIKTNAMYGSNDPKKSKLLKINPWRRIKIINLLSTRKYTLAIIC